MVSPACLLQSLCDACVQQPKSWTQCSSSWAHLAVSKCSACTEIQRGVPYGGRRHSPSFEVCPDKSRGSRALKNTHTMFSIDINLRATRIAWMASRGGAEGSRKYKGLIVSLMWVRYFTVRVLANPCFETQPESLLLQYITPADALCLNISNCQEYWMSYVVWQFSPGTQNQLGGTRRRAYLCRGFAKPF